MDTLEYNKESHDLKIDDTTNVGLAKQVERMQTILARQPVSSMRASGL